MYLFCALFALFGPSRPPKRASVRCALAAPSGRISTRALDQLGIAVLKRQSAYSPKGTRSPEKASAVPCSALIALEWGFSTDATGPSRQQTRGMTQELPRDATAGADPGKGCRKARESVRDLRNVDVNADNRRVEVLFMYSDKTRPPIRHSIWRERLPIACLTDRRLGCCVACYGCAYAEDSVRTSAFVQIWTFPSRNQLCRTRCERLPTPS